MFQMIQSMSSFSPSCISLCSHPCPFSFRMSPYIPPLSTDSRAGNEKLSSKFNSKTVHLRCKNLLCWSSQVLARIHTSSNERCSLQFQCYRYIWQTLHRQGGKVSRDTLFELCIRFSNLPWLVTVLLLPQYLLSLITVSHVTARTRVSRAHMGVVPCFQWSFAFATKFLIASSFTSPTKRLNYVFREQSISHQLQNTKS